MGSIYNTYVQYKKTVMYLHDIICSTHEGGMSLLFAIPNWKSKRVLYVQTVYQTRFKVNLNKSSTLIPRVIGYGITSIILRDICKFMSG